MKNRNRNRLLGIAAVSALAIALSVTGCQNGNAPGAELPPDPTTTATVQIPLPAAARGVGITTARDHANHFEAFFTNTQSNVVFSATAASGDSYIEINLPAATYNILLLASNDLHGQFLLASSFVLNRAITAGPVNRVVMEMASIHIGIEAPRNVTVAELFDVDLTVYTRNPLLNPSPGMMSVNVNIDGATSQGGGGSQDWQGWFGNSEGPVLGSTFPFVAPLTPRDSNITISGSFNLNLGGTHRHFWIANPDHPIFGSYFSFPITFVAGAAMPDVEIDIVWPGNEPPPPQRLPLTITGIPAQYHNARAELRLRNIQTGGTAWGNVNARGTQIRFPHFWNPAAAGDHEVKLFLLEWGGMYNIPSIAIAAAAAEIPFADFAAVQPISITVTDIPPAHNGSWVSMEIWNLDGGNSFSSDTTVTAGSATLSINRWAMPGNYALRIWGEGGSFDERHISSRALVGGENVIPFADFTVEPPISITVTGIPPAAHNGPWVNMEIRNLNGGNNFFSGSTVTAGSATFAFNIWAMPGNYEIRMRRSFFDVMGPIDIGHIPSRALVRGENAIPWSEFTD